MGDDELMSITHNHLCHVLIVMTPTRVAEQVTDESMKGQNRCTIIPFPDKNTSGLNVVFVLKHFDTIDRDYNKESTHSFRHM